MGSCRALRAAAWVSAVLCAAGAPLPGWAQSASGAQGLLNDRFVINGGVFVFGTDLRASLNGQSVNNPEVDFDDTVGTASDAKRGRLDMLWRINPSHHLRFMYFNNDITRNKVLTRDVQWGDYTFQLGANLESKTEVSTYELAYEWAFLRAPTYELALSFGVHYTDLSLSVTGNATITGSIGSVPVARSVTSNLEPPLPVVGFRGGWAVSPDWYLDVQAQTFKFKIDGYDGHWSDVGVGATWMFTRNFGVGLGYNLFRTNLDIDRDNFNGDLRFGYSGLRVYLTGTF